MPDNEVAKLIAGLRTRLLDLSNSNKLLNFKHSERGKNHVRIIDELPNFLHKCLTGNDGEKTLTFRPLPEPENVFPDELDGIFLLTLEEARRLDPTWVELQAEEEDTTSNKGLKLDRQIRDRVRAQLGLPPTKEGKFTSVQEWARLHGIEPSFELPKSSEQGAEERHQDNEIQTLLYPDDLQAKLASVLDYANTAQAEMGANILHMAVGFLEWYEGPLAEKPMLAPLLLYPVEMQKKAMRSRGQYVFTIKGNQDPVINVTLQHRLGNDFGLILPSIVEDTDTAESYLDRVDQMVGSQPRWKVRRFGTLGLFSFSRLAMYADLDPTRWGGDEALAMQGVLGTLFGSREGGDWAPPAEYDLEDPKIDAEVPLLILDADASQHQAVIEVLRGNSLVIKGPPGTGKSQTIANIIAAALAKGQKVLFVAEKAAALDVVKKRLDNAKSGGICLGDFCLEVHSTKARKSEVLASLGRRMRLPRPARTPDLAALASDHLEIRQGFTRYAQLLNQPFGAMDLMERGTWRRATIHDILWAEQRTRHSIQNFQNFHIVERMSLLNAQQTTRMDVDRRRKLLVSIQALANEFIAAFGCPGQHPWSSVSRRDITFLDVGEIHGLLDTLRGALTLLEGLCTERLSLFQTSSNGGSMRECAILGHNLRTLPVPPEAADDALLRLSLGSEERTRDLLALVESILWCREWAAACAKHLEQGYTLNGSAVPELCRLAALATREGLEHRTLVELAEIANRLRGDLEKQQQGLRLAKQLLGILGLPEHPVTPGAIRRITEAQELLARVDREAILARSQEVNDELAHSTLVKARIQLQSLLRQESAFRSEFVLDTSVTVSQVRLQASVFRTTGFLGKFGKDYRSAKKACLERYKGSAPFEPATFAKRLGELADHLEARQNFEDNKQIQRLCGKRCLGLDTDIEAMLAANQLATAARVAFPGLDALDYALRQLILEANLETIGGFLASHSDLDKAKFSGLLQGERDPEEDLEVALLRAETLALSSAEIYGGLIGMHLRMETTPQGAEQLAADLQEALKAEETLAAGSGARLLPAGQWQGMETDITPIKAAADFAKSVLIVGLSPAILGYILGTSEPVKIVFNRLQEFGQSFTDSSAGSLEAASAFLGRIVESSAFPEVLEEFERASFADLSPRLQAMAGADDQLMAWITFCDHLGEAREEGLSPVLEACGDLLACTRIPWDLSEIHDRMLCRTLARQILADHPELERHLPGQHDQSRRRFSDLDGTITEVRLQLLLSQRSADPYPVGVRSQRKGECTEATLIQNELEKTTRHIPIRDLFNRAALALKAMKPCMMMSPASVSQFLKPEQVFDLVIIDEASQVRPEEALGALARGRQAVIVGDSQQLPPTNFFQRQPVDGQIGEEDDSEGVVAQSVLDFAIGAFPTSRELLWHYRSRHGSLIAFSNRHFYNDRLVVFPSPQEGLPEHGVRSVFVKGTYRASVNIPEVQTVARAAVAFMAANPDKSLGIVALNQPQRDLILAEMERIFIRDRTAQDYREKWGETLEPFFVKNLENVQGDERDVIFISTVYGPDADGTVMQRFGPINGASGDRRLNVLFSRAKHGVTVFTSMRPEDVKADEKTPRGTVLLKEYLAYAATGRLDSGHVLYRECDSDFELFVKERLEARGYQVAAQVGVAGFRIDLGLKHPSWPYGFLLGIECDGATYHSSRSARDRDHLRQRVLENLGWTIYRVWSTDWFRDSSREMLKLVEFIDSTLRARIQDQTRTASRQTSAHLPPETKAQSDASQVEQNETEKVEPASAGTIDQIPIPGIAPRQRIQHLHRSKTPGARQQDVPTAQVFSATQVKHEGTSRTVFTPIQEKEEKRRVRIGDRVSFVNFNTPEVEVILQIVDGQGHPLEGTLAASTPLAKALLGLSEGESGEQIVYGHLERKVRVTGICSVVD